MKEILTSITTFFLKWDTSSSVVSFNFACLACRAQLTQEAHLFHSLPSALSQGVLELASSCLDIADFVHLVSTPHSALSYQQLEISHHGSICSTKTTQYYKGGLVPTSEMIYRHSTDNTLQQLAAALLSQERLGYAVVTNIPQILVS